MISSGRWLPLWVASSQPDEEISTFVFPTTEPGSEETSIKHDKPLFRDKTIRQSMRVSLDAPRIRLRVSNEHCDTSLRIDGMTMALPIPDDDGVQCGSPSIRKDTIHHITFFGSASVEIAPGTFAITDEIPLSVQSGHDLTISLYLKEGQLGGRVTGHRRGKTLTFVSSGNQIEAETMVSELQQGRKRWFLVTAIEGHVDRSTKIIACFGDSITDGGYPALRPNAYLGWPDRLFERLQETKGGGGWGVANFGSGGYRLWDKGMPSFQHELLTYEGIHTVIVHMGVNDIGSTAATEEAQQGMYEHLVFTFGQIIVLCRSRGYRIWGSTIMPFMAPEESEKKTKFVDPLRDEYGKRLNHWIRTTAGFDHVIDWASVVSDPSRPSYMQPHLHHGDWLHPSEEGAVVMAKAIDLDSLLKT